MDKKDAEIFAEVMGWIGDVWTPEEAEECFEEVSLREAIEERLNSINHLQDMMYKVIETNKREDLKECV